MVQNPWVTLGMKVLALKKGEKKERTPIKEW
jgi:hypothetical protein